MRRLLDLLEATRIREWYSGLAARDRVALTILATFIAASVVWLAIVQPVIRWRESEASRHAAALAALTWMQSHRASVSAANPAQPGSERGLLSAVAAAARAHQVTLSRYQPESSGQVTVELQGQSFNAVIGWIEALRARQGIEVTFLNLQRTDSPGMVNGRIRFGR